MIEQEKIDYIIEKVISKKELEKKISTNKDLITVNRNLIISSLGAHIFELIMIIILIISG